MAQIVSTRLSGRKKSQSTCPQSPTDDDMLLEPLRQAQAVHVGDFINSPINRVRDIITDPDNHGLDDEQHKPKPIFCEMMDLVHEVAHKKQKQIVWPPVRSSHVSWQEKARWIKYEETVEEGQSRFSKPHITLLNVPSLLQIKNCLKKGCALIDDDSTNFQQLAENITETWMSAHKLPHQMAIPLTTLLTAPKQHLVKNKMQTFGADSTDSDSDGSDSSESHHGVKHNFNANLLRKLAPGTEAAVVLAGEVREISHTLAAFVRLREPQLMHPELPELPVPVRFVFVLLVPFNHYKDEYISIGRAMGSMLVDQIFSQVCYRAKTVYDIIDAVEEFLSKTTLVPPGKWNPAYRWEPQEEMPPTSREIGELTQITQVHDSSSSEDEDDKHKSHFKEMGLSRTGIPFGGLYEDIMRKSKWYWSDFKDAFAAASLTKILASTIFLFFANLTIIITFSGLMTHLLEGQIGASENILAGCICGIIFALLGGQPLCILSATGPVLIFESIMYEFCKTQDWEFLPMRFWVGIWTAVFLLILVMTDTSVLVGLITRFTEEAFATLISVIFIVKAVQGINHMQETSPITPDPEIALQDPCICYFKGNMTKKAFKVIDDVSNITWDETVANMTKKECILDGGHPRGLMCDFHPDVFLFSIILFAGTFLIAMALKWLRESNIFPTKVREFVTDFKVLIAILSMTLINYYTGLHEDFLHIPNNFQTTSGRPWLVNPGALNEWYHALLAAVPALFFTVLIAMDQHITTVIINRKDNNLKKGYGYHLDLLVIGLLMTVCATLGLPYYVASTVISLMHVYSLRQVAKSRAPGETPQFLGILEQRVTALFAHILIGLSVFLTPLIRLIPLPVLLGVFLFMGVVTLISQQFYERFILLFTPIKHQPDVPYLRIVHIRRVHLFTLFQLMGLVLLFIVKFIQQISWIFPLMLVLMMLIRKLLEFIFSQKELRALDDPLPTLREVMKTKRRKRRAKQIKKNDSEGVRLVSTSPINPEGRNKDGKCDAMLHTDEEDEEENGPMQLRFEDDKKE